MLTQVPVSPGHTCTSSRGRESLRLFTTATPLEWPTQGLRLSQSEQAHPPSNFLFHCPPSSTCKCNPCNHTTSQNPQKTGPEAGLPRTVSWLDH